MTRNTPEEFAKYLIYVRNLNFEEKPDYNYMRGLFRQLLQNSGYTNDGMYDWILKKEGQQNALAAMKAKDEKKAPLPRAAGMAQGAAANRGSSHNLIEDRENRKEIRANIGAQVIAGTRNTSARNAQLPKGVSPTLAQFANHP